MNWLKLASTWAMEAGSGRGVVGASLFRDAVFDKFLVSVNRDVLKNCAVNVIEMHSVIIHTYIDNQSKKINR